MFADRPEAVLAAAGQVTRAPQADATVTGAAAARELAYDATLRFTHELRSAVRELGTRLAGQEKLAAAEDIFYLTTEEALVMPVDARLRIKRRRRAGAVAGLGVTPVINGRWEPLTAHRPADNGELRGRIVSPGVAEGTVRVLGSVDDAGLTSGGSPSGRGGPRLRDPPRALPPRWSQTPGAAPRIPPWSPAISGCRSWSTFPARRPGW